MKNLICINCPMGCHLEVDDSDINNIIVKGNNCKRGEIYAKNEVTHPKRMVTSSVFVNNGNINVVSVKTDNPIDKNLIFDVIKILKEIKVDAPVRIGDIIVKNILNTDVSIIATKNVERI